MTTLSLTQLHVFRNLRRLQINTMHKYYCVLYIHIFLHKAKMASFVYRIGLRVYYKIQYVSRIPLTLDE